MPSLCEFISFPIMASSKVNLAQKIGTEYIKFGILLLQDGTGSRIEKECNNNAENINIKIFSLWVRGEGLKPLSWATLVKVLQDIQLNELAVSIQQVTV